jgi:hypothetical protein
MATFAKNSSTLEASVAANTGNTSTLEACATATSGGGIDNNKVSFQQLSRRWRSSHRNGLELRLFTGLWLNDQHGPPTSRQDYGPGTLKKYQTSLGVGESDVSRMRWFAHEFKSVKDFLVQHPTATTWTKVKEVLAQLRRPQAALAVKPPSDEMKLVVVDRPVDQLIGVMQTLRSRATKVGKLTADGVEWKALHKAFEGVMKDVGACLGIQFTFPDAAMPGQPVASAATTCLADQVRVPAFESASVLKLPATAFGPAGNDHFEPLLHS